MYCTDRHEASHGRCATHGRTDGRTNERAYTYHHAETVSTMEGLLHDERRWFSTWVNHLLPSLTCIDNRFEKMLKTDAVAAELAVVVYDTI